MRLKNRLSPYPILDNYSDDYLNSVFKADIEVETLFSEIHGKIKFILDNEEIRQLIKNKMAEYLVHVECPSTSYRLKYSSSEDEIAFMLNTNDVAKKIEIRTFIVLTDDIYDFESTDFHPDYKGQKFNLLSHQIIAIGTGKDFSIKKDERDLESLPSVLRIVKLNDKRKGSISVNTDNDDYVIVGLNEEVYKLYARLGKNVYKSTAFSLVLLPAILIVIQRMSDNRDDEEYKSRHWFNVINTILIKNNVKLEDVSIENDSLLSVCQSIFSNPILRSFQELDIQSERM